MALQHSDAEHHLAKKLASPDVVEKLEKIALGEQIKRLRKRLHFTQKQLAAKLHTTQSVIARIEGGRQNLSLHTLVLLASVFGKRLFVRLH